MDRGRQPIGPKFWCQREGLITMVICRMFKKNLFILWQNFDVNRNIFSLQSFVASFKKISLKSDFIHLFFMILYIYRPWGRQPPGDKVLISTEMSCHFIHLLQVSKICLWSLILYNFFHDLIHVYSPRAGVDSPQGTKVWCQKQGLITLPICCKFQRNLFEVWFYTTFFMI